MALFISGLWRSLRRQPPRPRPNGGRRRPLFECLETRQLLSASFPGALVPRGPGADHYIVDVRLAPQPVVEVSIDGGATFLNYTPSGSWDPSARVADLGGTGTFYAPQGAPAGVPSSLLLLSADFNGDGTPDYALVMENRVNLLLSQPAGGYQTALTVAPAPGGQVLFLAVGDFNGAGHPDLATISRGPGQEGLNLDVLLGHGLGSFQTRVDLQTTPGVYAVNVGSWNSPDTLELGDLTGDGSLGLVLTHRDPGTTTGQTSIFDSTSDGTFQAAPPPDASPAPAAPTGGDVAAVPTAPDGPAAPEGPVAPPLAPDGPVAPVPPPADSPLVPEGPVAPSPGQSDAASLSSSDLSAQTPAPYFAVGPASGETSLPIQVLVLPGADSSGNGYDEGVTPVAAADTAAAVNLTVSVDATGSGDYQIVPLSLTEYQPSVLPGSASASAAAAANLGSPTAAPTAPAVPLSAPGTSAGDPAKRDSGPDLDNSRPAGSSDPTPLSGAAGADPVTSPSFVPLPELSSRPEDLPALQLLEIGLPAPVAPPGPEGPRAAPATSDGKDAAAVPPGPAVPAAAGLWAGPEGPALPADVAFWSRLGRDALLGDDAGLRRLERGDALPSAANETSGARSALLKVGQFLAQAFYLQRLQSAAGATPDAAGLAEAAADARLGAAEAVQEAATEFVRVVRGFYERFLGRQAVNGEESGWVNMLLGGQTEEQVLSAFLSTEEFGRRAAEMVASVTPDEAFIAGLYTLLLLRAAADEELTGWLTALPTLGRRGVALALLRSVEYRRRQVECFYRELLQRDGDAEEVAGWAATPFDLQKVRGYFLSRPDLFGNS